MAIKSVPALMPRQLIRALKRLGFIEDRQKGSHLVLIHQTSRRMTVVPIHAKTIKKPLLLSIIKNDVGISVKEFLQYL